MKKNKQKNHIDIFNEIRKPIAPPSSVHVDRKDKRVKRFDYKQELKHY